MRLSRQIGHQHAGDVSQRLYVVHPQDPGVVGDHVVLLDRLVGIPLRQLGRRPFRHDVRLDGSRRVCHNVSIEELEVRYVGHDGGADMEIRTQPSDVIEVRV